MSEPSIREGEPFPEFDLPTDGGGRISSAALRGRPYVLYLYPKDDTPGCTKEAQGFTGHHQEFTDLGVEVIGLSKDDVRSHDQFKAKYGLSVPLATDDGDLIERLGCWVEKSMYGRTYMGVDRTTFLVDGDGIARRIWRKVQVPGHVEEVLEAARELSPGKAA